MSMDEEAIAAGLRRLRINKQLSAVKVAFGPLGFGKDLGNTCLWQCGAPGDQSDDIFRAFQGLKAFIALFCCCLRLCIVNMARSSRGLLMLRAATW